MDSKSTNDVWGKEPPKPVLQIPRSKHFTAKKNKLKTGKKYIMAVYRPKPQEKFYGSAQWKAFRDDYKKKHPLCELNLVNDQLVPAEQIHHLVKWYSQPSDELKWMLFLDEDNVISISSQLHTYIHYKRKYLTKEQIDWLNQKKEEVFQKYFTKNILIKVDDDINRPEDLWTDDYEPPKPGGS